MIEPPDLASLAVIVVGISVLASLLGIWKAHERGAQQGARRMNAPPDNTMPAIEVAHLRKVYGSGNTEVVAMRDVSLQRGARRGRRLLGPSGAGKSTLLTAIGLINPPTSGRIVIGGKPVHGWTAALVDLRAFRRQHLGFVFQKANLIPFLTAVENVQVALEINDAAPRAARQRAHGTARLPRRRPPRARISPTRSPAASNSASPWPAPWPTSRA